MKIEFYFDPSCPFCWVTSRWLMMVQPERKLDIAWRQFSLAIKNSLLTGGDKAWSADQHAEIHLAAHRINRVILAAHEKHGADLLNLYTEFGKPFHLLDHPYDDELIKRILSEQDLPAELIKAADDTSYDDKLAASVKSATDVAGEDIGVPTIVFIHADGSKTGYFGPVLQELPDKAEALELWDGLSKLASNKSFYELKRSRESGGPDVFSTTKC